MKRKADSSHREILKRVALKRHFRNLTSKEKKLKKNRSFSGALHHAPHPKLRHKNNNHESHREVIPLPNNLDLMNKFEEVAYITRQMRRLVLKEKKSAILDFSDVKTLKPAAMLLLLAEIHRCRLIYGPDHITGTYPTEPRIERMLNCTGFFSLLDVAPRRKTRRAKYPMEYVDFVSNTHEVKGTIKDFREKLLGTSIAMTPQAKNKLYRVLTEAMLNVSYHAYPLSAAKTNPQRGRWWLAGHVNRRSKELMIMFCDLGVGIPRTLPKLYKMEVIRNLLSILPGINPNDGQMIQAAMQLGRSSARQTNRGKGLNDLRSFVDNAGAGELHIFSGHGHYLYKPGQAEIVRNYATGIAGTLIKWTVPMEAVTNWAGNDGDEDDDDTTEED
jgi:hypothetical protein